MPLTNAQAILLSNDAFLAGMIENEPRRIQLAQIFPFFPIKGNAYTIPAFTAANLGAAAIFDAGATAVSDTPAVPTSPNVSFTHKLLISAFKNNYTAQYDMSDVNDQQAIQTLAAVRRLLYLFWTKFYTGDQTANPQEFNGLRTLVTAGQTITANAGAGGQPTLNEFDQALSLVNADPQDVVMVVDNKGYQLWRKAHYNVNSIPPSLPVEVPDPMGGTRTVYMPHQDGARVVVDNSITNDEQPGGIGTSAYFIVPGKEGLFGIVPEGTEKTMFRSDKALVDGKAQDNIVISWAVGLALASQTKVSRVKQMG